MKKIYMKICVRYNNCITTVTQFQIQISHCRTLSYSSARKRWDNVNESSSNSLWLSFSKILEFSQVADYVELQWWSPIERIKLLWICLKTCNGIIIRTLVALRRLVYFINIIFYWQFFEIFQPILIGFSMQSRLISCLKTRDSRNNPEFRPSKCASNSSVLFSKLSLRWVLT